MGNIWRVCESQKVSQRSEIQNFRYIQELKSTLKGAKMCQKAKENGQFKMNCPTLAGAEGLEPSARGFGDRCSTN